MEKVGNRLNRLFRLTASLIFIRWSFLLLSMDAYLFADPTSYLFWSVAIKRVLLAAFLSLGLVSATIKIGQRYWPVSIVWIVLSMAGSFFIVPEKLYWVYWIVSVFVHSYAIFNLVKNKRLKQQPV